MGRHKLLGDVQKREICALVTAGMSMEKVARYVGCGRKTIYRERQDDKDFDFRLRRARMAADLNPREAMRRFAATHWRAAAWMLEREERHEAERRANAANHFTRDDLEGICFQVKQLITSRHLVDLSQGMPLVDQIDKIFLRAEPATATSKQRSLPMMPKPTVEESIAYLERVWSERAAGSNDSHVLPAGTPDDIRQVFNEIADAISPTADYDPIGSDSAEPKTAEREKVPMDAE